MNIVLTEAFLATLTLLTPVIPLALLDRLVYLATPPPLSILMDRILALKWCVASICTYQGISFSVIPDDGSISLPELFRHIATLKADGQQDLAKIEALLKNSTRQDATIAALQIKVEELELTSKSLFFYQHHCHKRRYKRSPQRS